MELEDLRTELNEPTDRRVFAVARALKEGMSVEAVHELTKIDHWFLSRVQHITNFARALESSPRNPLTREQLRELKIAGFSDRQLGKFIGKDEEHVFQLRHELGVHPVIKQIDTLAAEYPAKTNYLYLTYAGEENDIEFGDEKPVLVLGSGAYRIGSSVEFDWCCVNTVRTLRELGYRTLMLNCNPETVSTDYDECDRLYFDELSFETVREIYERERAHGVVVCVGGQSSNNLAPRLSDIGVRILGTSATSIDNAEDRHKFSALCDRLGVDQPDWVEVTTAKAAEAFADRVGYPVLVRPSYVLSGAAMAVVENHESLRIVLERAADVSPEHPIVLTRFITGAKEIELDAVARQGEILVHAISEHVENAGVHSGDATLVLPPQRTYVETTRRVKRIASKIARALNIDGPFNIQFIAQQNEVKVIECNLRASRSFPFVSKVFKVNFIDLMTRVIMNRPIERVESSVFELDYVGVKAPEFSFSRLEGADPILGVEMASTGEVGCIGDDFEDAFLKSMVSVGLKLPVQRVLVSSGPLESKAVLLASTRDLHESGVSFFATKGTAALMQEGQIPVTVVHWPLEGKSPNAVDLIREGKVDLVINIPKDASLDELKNDYMIRRAAVEHGVPLITNVQLAQRLALALCHKPLEALEIRSWEDY